jgi:hypothetical protein
MHDWLAWNVARWDLGRRAIARGIAATDIEGGFEWDGWHASRVFLLPDEPPATRSLLQDRGSMLLFRHLLFPELTGRYAISFSEIPGTMTVDSEPYRLWLAPGPRRLWLLACHPVESAQEGKR